MGQTVRYSKERPDRYWETIRERINVGQALKIWNDYMLGEHEDTQRALIAWKAIDKMMPSMQAIALQVDDRRPKSIHDLQARAMALGIDPAAILGTVSESKPELLESNTNARVEDKTPLEAESQPVTQSNSNTEPVQAKSESEPDS